MDHDDGSSDEVRYPSADQPAPQDALPSAPHPPDKFGQPYPIERYPPPGYQPGYDDRGYPAQGYQQPGYPPPGYQQPGYPPPGYQQPGYPPPGYQQPGYQPQPGFPAQYGAAATAEYGQPQQAKRRSRVGLWITLVAVVLVVAVGALLAFVTPGFLVRKTFSARSVAATIEDQSKGRGDYTNVTCPSGEKVKKGTTFTCIANGGKKITVKVTSGSGDYTWEPAG
ncbi:MAG: DUF4333 domain-containing protein [Actinomycetota bacterium]